MRDWLAQRASATPTATALVAPGEEAQALTYAALDDRVEELAGRLSSLGLDVDDHLGVCMSTRPAFAELVHAAMRVGAVLVPLSARLTRPELATRCTRADVSLVVGDAKTEETLVDAAGEADASVATVDQPTAGATALCETVPETFDLPAWDNECTQVLATTSGTTGDPKLVTLTTGNLLSSAMTSAWRLGVLPDDRWYDPLPMYHVGGLAPVFRSVLYGTSVVVPHAEGFDAERAIEEMRATGATCVSLVPTMLDRLLDVVDRKARGGTDGTASEGSEATDGRGRALSDSLRVVLLGGAPAPDDLVERAIDRDVPVHPTYGMTETASQVATARPRDVEVALGSVGNPLVFTDVTVVDGNGSRQEPGEAGELVVSGPTVTPGYYGGPESTREAFGTHGFHTGDVGYRDDEGRVWVLNRLDDRIVTGGENVDPGEVVAALREHPAVADAAVVGLPDETFGERVAALIVPDGDPSWEDVESDLRERLAGFKLPRTVAFAEALPRTPSGTVDREAVRDRLEAE